LIDKYWILLYQLFFDDKIKNPYSFEKLYTGFTKSRKDTLKNASDREILVFNYLKKKGVSFFRKEYIDKD
jgi:hypothetical protein